MKLTQFDSKNVTGKGGQVFDEMCGSTFNIFEPFSEARAVLQTPKVTGLQAVCRWLALDMMTIFGKC